MILWINGFFLYSFYFNKIDYKLLFIKLDKLQLTPKTHNKHHNSYKSVMFLALYNLLKH